MAMHPMLTSDDGLIRSCNALLPAATPTGSVNPVAPNHVIAAP